ncbi:MAG: 4-hydroxy-tetrahydrodipicolinate reductase [Cypionkella sp.]|nr:4-hydroxy-tetrahydrodipicolinate reductase [Cypionkella sp.]
MNSVKVVITGATGRMGQMLLREVAAHPDMHIAGAIERAGNPHIGRDIGAVLGGPDMGVAITDDALAVFATAHAVIDFTAPEATVEFAALAAQARIVHVVGTTGLQAEHHAKLDAAARHAVIVQAGNMSLGVNLLARMTQKVAQALGDHWDIEIVEAHHNKKVDAPSGTALMLGQAAADGRGVELAAQIDSGRDGITGARVQGKIGFSAIRGGDIVGEHDVIFAAAGERVVLRHIATDRAIFARGALSAAVWGQGQKPGRYDMMDVLGI